MSLCAFEEKKHSVHLDLCQLSHLDDCIAVDRFECIAGLASVEGGVQRLQLVDLEHAPLKKISEMKKASGKQLPNIRCMYIIPVG